MESFIHTLPFLIGFIFGFFYRPIQTFYKAYQSLMCIYHFHRYMNAETDFRMEYHSNGFQRHFCNIR